MRDEKRGGRRSSRLLRASVLIPAALVVGIGLVVVGYIATNRVRTPTFDFVVPDGYVGWLVVGWGCEGGQPLAAYRTAEEDRYLIRYETDGSVCISDPFPEDGYVARRYAYAGGAPAPVLSGYTTAERLLATPGADPVFPRWQFSVDAIRQGDGRILGDRCDLDAFLLDRFGYPPPPNPLCEPLYAQRGPDAATSTATD